MCVSSDGDVTLLAVPVAAKDVEQNASTRSTFFVAYDTYLWKTSTYGFQIWFDITACEIMTELGVSEIILERSKDGGATWGKLKTFTPDEYPQMLDQNTSVHESYVTYMGFPGYQYRAQVTFHAKKSNGSTGEYYATSAPMTL